MNANPVHLSRVFLSAYDPLLGEQTRIAAEICCKMATEPYFTPEDRETLLVASETYHLGFIKLDRALLPHRIGKDASREEWDIYSTHPIESAAMAEELGVSAAVSTCIREHHERFDGNGYPEGIQGLTLSWPARCLAVAAFFAESRETREETLDRLLSLSGTGFDPEAVRLFFKMTQDDLPAQIQEVMVDELVPGMKLADRIETRQGMLLVPEGAILDQSSVRKIQNYNFQGEVTKRLLVFR